MNFNAEENFVNTGYDPMLEVVRNIQHIQTISYSGLLYRADEIKLQPGITANMAPTYHDATIKYFTLHSEELDTYFRNKNYRYETAWQTSPITLVNLHHIPTRNFLYEHVFTDGEREALNTAFPVNAKGEVYRQSEEHTAHLDYTMLRALCRIEGVDGYYMEAQQRRSNGRNIISGFHSEVGLCGKAFLKLTCVSSVLKAAEKITKRRRRREELEEETDETESQNTVSMYAPSIKKFTFNNMTGGTRKRHGQGRKIRKTRRSSFKRKV